MFKRNIFIISMLRQPLRSFLLALVISLASFGFVLRASEYFAIRGHIDAVAASYNTIGFLQSAGFFADVSAGAKIIANSPFVEFEDYRRVAGAVMQGIHAADMEGMRTVSAVNEPRLTFAYFYGELIGRAPGELTFLVYEVLAGIPEHVGVPPDNVQRVRVRYEDSEHVEDMAVGGRYFVRAVYLQQFHPQFGVLHLPNMGWHDNILYLLPPDDFAPDIAALNENHRSVLLHTTKDMNLMSIAQSNNRFLQLINSFPRTGGRYISREDYENKNHVAVISSRLAVTRGLDVGDNIMVHIPKTQYIDGIFSADTDVGAFGDYILRGEPGAPYYELKLEIVGIAYYRLHRFHQLSSMYIYIPDSILPRDIEYIPAAPHVEHMPPVAAGRYSFTLKEPRHEQQFMAEYAPKLEPLGIELIIKWSGAGNFWVSADLIMMMAVFNAVTTAIVLAVVLIVAAFIYLHQRRRDMAILMGIGIPKRNIMLALCASILIFAAPAAAAGGLAGLQFALNESTAASIDENLGQAQIRAAAAADFWTRDTSVIMQAGTGLSAVHNTALITCVLVFFLLLIILGAAYSLRLPALDILQGIRPWGRRPQTPATFEKVDKTFNVRVFSEGLKLSKTGRFLSAIRFIFRHLYRSRVKTAITAAAGLVFTLAIGGMQETISRTEAELDRLYNTIVVDVSIQDGDISKRFLDRILEFGFVQNVYMESGDFRAFLLPPDESGAFPENWHEIIGFNLTLHVTSRANAEALDHILGIADMERFTDINTNRYVDGNAGSISIEYIENFGNDNFTYDDGSLRMPVPVIAAQSTMNRWGLSLGDNVYIGYRVNTPMIVWNNAPAVIVGVHNEHILGSGSQKAFIAPLGFMETAFAAGTDLWFNYTVLNFSIDTAYNRTLDDVRENLAFAAARMFMYDEELRNVTSAVEQTLIFLRMLYPIMVAVIIVFTVTTALLLMLQNTIKAAIMCVLGSSKQKIRLVLCLEQLAVFFAGTAVGLCLLYIMKWGFGPISVTAAAGLCFAGVAAGSFTGALVVTAKQPLDLLQVRE